MLLTSLKVPVIVVPAEFVTVTREIGLDPAFTVGTATFVQSFRLEHADMSSFFT